MRWYFDGRNFSYSDNDDGRQVSRICCRPVHSTKFSTEAIQRNAQMLPLNLGMGDRNASSSDSDHKKENIEPAEKKHKSLKLNRKEADRLDFIGEEHENNLSRKYVPKNTA